MPREDRPYEEMARENAELRRRACDLERHVRALEISKEALKLDKARLEALLKLTQMSGASEQEIADFALEEAVLPAGAKRAGWGRSTRAAGWSHPIISPAGRLPSGQPVRGHASCSMTKRS